MGGRGFFQKIKKDVNEETFSFLCLQLNFTNQWRIQDFPEEGALTSKGGRQPIIWPISAENCMKMKKFWAGGGARPSRPPLRSATAN